MEEILQNIISVKKQQVAQNSQKTPLSELQKILPNLPPCRDFYRAMTKPNPRGINVIAEIKRASPSAGLIRADFDPVKLAQIYQAAPADAISVLTDPHFFQGSLDDLRRVKHTVSLPILRKDFIIDPYQLYEARAAGADAILLIAEALTPSTLSDLLSLAHSLTLTVLLEVHESESLQTVQPLLGPSVLLGINNRNLKTMKVDINHCLHLAGQLPDKTALVAESGIQTRSDVQKVIHAGFAGILIGQTLMASPDIAQTFHTLFDLEG